MGLPWVEACGHEPIPSHSADSGGQNGDLQAVQGDSVALERMSECAVS